MCGGGRYNNFSHFKKKKKIYYYSWLSSMCLDTIEHWTCNSRSVCASSDLSPFHAKQLKHVKIQSNETHSWSEQAPLISVCLSPIFPNHPLSVVRESLSKRPSFHISLFLWASLVPCCLSLVASLCSHLRVAHCVNAVTCTFGSYCCSLTLLIDKFNLLCSPLSLVL